MEACFSSCGTLKGATPRRRWRPINVPVNQWFYLEAYYESRETASGRITIWQGDEVNRTLLWDLAGVQTRFPGGWTEWYVSNYSSGLDVQPAFIGIDNAEIRLP